MDRCPGAQRQCSESNCRDRQRLRGRNEPTVLTMHALDQGPTIWDTLAILQHTHQTLIQEESPPAKRTASNSDWGEVAHLQRLA